MNPILIALDFSKSSPEVESLGYALARKTGAPVTLICIINKFIDYMPVDTGVVFENNWDARKAIASDSLQEIKEKYADVSTHIVSFVGNPREDIIEYSLEHPTELIVIGTHGRTGLSHLLMGSTAEYITRHSVVPILVVPIKKNRH